MWQVYGLVKNSKIIYVGIKKKRTHLNLDMVYFDNLIILDECSSFEEVFCMCQYQLNVNKVLEG